MNRQLFERIAQGYCVLTPTQNLAQRILDAYALQQLEQGIHSWPTPAVTSWFGWCHQLWEELIFQRPDLPRLLNSYESQLLWQQVIEGSRYQQGIIHVRTTARQVQAADQLTQAWLIEEIPETLYTNVDAFAFKVWRESYELRLSANHWVDEARLIKYLVEDIDLLSGVLDELVIYGFDEISPQQQRLIDAVAKKDFHLEPMTAENIHQSYSVRAYDDTSAELSGLSNWIIDIHRQHPDARIGVVIPNIRHQREQIIGALEQHLVVENYFRSFANLSLPFTVASGKALDKYPIIHCALTILSMTYHPIQISSLSMLLRSPFIAGYEEEESQRQQFDLSLRERGQEAIGFDTFKNWHEELDSSRQIPLFMSALEQHFELLQVKVGEQNITEGLSQVTNILQAYAWPGIRELNSEEYQTMAAWQEILSMLSSMGGVAKYSRLKDLINILTWICSQHSFQPATELQPVELIDIIGASGMQYDFLWLFGMHDQAWPPAHQPNPFLPLSLQQQAGIPEASIEGRLEKAQTIFTALVQSAQHVIASYPMSDGDQVLRASPMLNLYESQSVKTPELVNLFHALEIDDVLERFEDQKAEPVKEGEVVTGGSSLFQDQAACPQRAFARHRLNASGQPQLDVGLSPLTKGNVLHRSLQLLWDKVKHSNNLKRMHDGLRQQTIEQVIEQACSEIIHGFDKNIIETTRQLEKRRLSVILDQYLEMEVQRDPFTVLATEKGHHAMINDIVIHMRIDRIDQLENGRLAIIDYKSGQVTANAWLGERPQDPQLPLYAITTDAEIAAVLIGRIRTGDIRYLGNSLGAIGDNKIHLYDETDWREMMAEWRHVLHNLAGEFRDGVATVEPMPYACRYCDLSGLCRIHERVLTLEELES